MAVAIELGLLFVLLVQAVAENCDNPNADWLQCSETIGYLAAFGLIVVPALAVFAFSRDVR